MPTLSSAELRRLILEQAHRAGVGHIGSALSVVEILAAVFQVLRGEPDAETKIIADKAVGWRMVAAHETYVCLLTNPTEKLQTVGIHWSPRVKAVDRHEANQIIRIEPNPTRLTLKPLESVALFGLVKSGK